MKVFIRTDSSFLIGTGHVSRCLSMAHFLRNSNISVTFVCRNLEGNIISFIEEKQFKVIRLSSPREPHISSEIYERWRGVPLDLEIQEFQKVLSKNLPDWVVVDHYSLSRKWESAVKKIGVKIFSIDDIYRNHDCDAFLDQNSLEPLSEFQRLTPRNAVLLIGPAYTLLDESFLKQDRTQSIKISGNRILIFFGGSDLTGETLKFVKSVISRTDLHFDVVVGKINKDLQEIQSLCNAKDNFHLHVQTPHMAKLMKQADLFIGAGGITTWERCYLGLPAICITTAENQVKIAKDLAAKNVHLYAGHFDQVLQQELVKSMDRLLGNEEQRKLYRKNSLRLEVASKTKDLINIFKC